MSEQEPEVMHPPIEQDDLPEKESTWPKTIGIISLIYAIGGLLCQVATGLSIVASDWLMGFQGIDIELPTLVKLTGGAMAVVVFVVGIFMLVGSIRLLQRKRTGPSLLKTWSVLRLVMVLLGLIVAILTTPTQVEIEKSMLELRNEKLREAGQGSKVKKINEETLQTGVMLKAVIGSGIFSIYPLFLGFYLSRKKITEEVQSW